MAIARFLIKRLVAQRALALGVVTTLAFAIGVMASTPVYVAGARAAIFHAAFATASEPVRDVRISMFEDPARWANADRDVRASVADLPAGTLVTQGLATGRNGADLSSLTLMFRDGAGDHLAFTDGVAPGPGEVAVPTGLAFANGLHTGDRFVVLGPADEHATLRVSGIFEQPQRTDRSFFGESSPFSLEEAAAPPVVVTRSTGLELARDLGLSCSFSWDLYLPWEAITYEQAQGLDPAFAGLEDEVWRRHPGQQPPHVTSGIPELIGDVRRSVGDLGVPVLLVAFQVLLVALTIVAGVGVLLAGRQGFELAVLHSRGFSRSWLFSAQFLQAAVAGAVALPFGLLFALGLARVAGSMTGDRPPGVAFPTALGAEAVGWGCAAAVASIVVLVLPSLVAVRRTILDERRQASREGRPVLSRVPVEVVVVPVGVLALWQLRRTGAALPSAGGSIDPILLFAPAVVIVGVTFLVVRVLSWFARAADGAVARTRRLATYLAGRRLSRSGDATFAAAILVVLSIALLVVSTSFRATSIRAHQDAARAALGAAWAADVDQGSDGPGTLPVLPTHMTTVGRFDIQGSEPSLPAGTSGVAVDLATFEVGAWWRDDVEGGSSASYLTPLDVPPPGEPVPEDADRLKMEITTPRAAGSLAVTATFAHPDGSIASAPPQALGAGARRYVIDLDGASRLLSITFSSPVTDDVTRRISLGIAAVRLGGQPLSLERWISIAHANTSGRLRGAGAAWRYVIEPEPGSLEGGIQPAPTPLPAVVSTQVAASSMQVRIAGVDVPVTVIARAPAFPGVARMSPFIVVSLPALSDIVRSVPEPAPFPLQVWSMDEDPRPALAAAGVSVPEVRSASVLQSGLDQQPSTLALGMDAAATIAGLGLVIAGVSATLYLAQRRRSYEFAALRAMGTAPRVLRSAIAREQGIVVATASAAGIGLGICSVLLALPQLRASAGVVYPLPALVIDVRTIVLALGAIGVATIVAVRAAGRAAVRVPITTVLRGEAE